MKRPDWYLLSYICIVALVVLSLADGCDRNTARKELAAARDSLYRTERLSPSPLWEHYYLGWDGTQHILIPKPATDSARD